MDEYATYKDDSALASFSDGISLVSRDIRLILSKYNTIFVRKDKAKKQQEKTMTA